MRHALLVLPLLFAAAPASATQGFLCRTVAPEGVTVSVVVGTRGIAGANLTESGRRLSTFGEAGLVLGQRWIDERALLLDLLDPVTHDRVARLRVGIGGPVETRRPTGTLDYRGIVTRVVCEID